MLAYMGNPRCVGSLQGVATFVVHVTGFWNGFQSYTSLFRARVARNIM